VVFIIVRPYLYSPKTPPTPPLTPEQQELKLAQEAINRGELRGNMTVDQTVQALNKYVNNSAVISGAIYKYGKEVIEVEMSKVRVLSDHQELNVTYTLAIPGLDKKTFATLLFSSPLKATDFRLVNWQVVPKEKLFE